MVKPKNSLHDALIFFIVGSIVSFAAAYGADNLAISRWGYVLMVFFTVISVGFWFLWQWIAVLKGKTDSLEMHLLSERAILINGMLEVEKAVRWLFLIRALNQDDQKRPITLFINSDGGETQALYVLMRAIRASHAPIYGVVTHHANSAAALLLQLCAKRYALPTASVMFHQVRYRSDTMSQSFTLKARKGIFQQMQTIFRLLKNEQEFLDTLVCARSGLSVEELREIDDMRIDAQEAKRLNLIDDIAKEL